MRQYTRTQNVRLTHSFYPVLVDVVPAALEWYAFCKETKDKMTINKHQSGTCQDLVGDTGFPLFAVRHDPSLRGWQAITHSYTYFEVYFSSSLSHWEIPLPFRAVWGPLRPQAEENGNSSNRILKGNKVLYAKRGSQPQIKHLLILSINNTKKQNKESLQKKIARGEKRAIKKKKRLRRNGPISFFFSPRGNEDPHNSH